MSERILICYVTACNNPAHPCGYNRVTHGLYCIGCAREINEISKDEWGGEFFPLLKHRSSVTPGGALRLGVINVRPQGNDLTDGEAMCWAEDIAENDYPDMLEELGKLSAFLPQSEVSQMRADWKELDEYDISVHPNRDPEESLDAFYLRGRFAINHDEDNDDYLLQYGRANSTGGEKIISVPLRDCNEHFQGLSGPADFVKLGQEHWEKAKEILRDLQYPFFREL